MNAQQINQAKYTINENLCKGRENMSEKIIENNRVTIMGEVASALTYNHEVYGEKFYTVDVLVRRISNAIDMVPILISERLINAEQDYTGELVKISGQFRSYNKQTENGRKLVLQVFVREIEFVDEVPNDENANSILLDGYICKEPIYRETPFGREIADILLGVNRPYGKSDYIPCICWGRNARYASGFKVGEHVKIIGRIQSREYTKKISETEVEKRTAREVSVSKLEVLEDEK